MKKVLIGIGIGCGVLVVLGGILMVGGAWFVSRRVAGVAQSAQQMSAKMQAQNDALKHLDSEYPFQAPANGQPLALDEGRLEKYLAVREAALPIFDEFQKQTKEFDAKHKNANGMEALSAAAEGMGMLGDLTVKLRASYAQSLETQKMGPAEFEAITGAIYSAGFGAAMAQQPAIAKQEIAEIDKQIAQTSDPQTKAALEQSKAQFEKMQANAPDPKVAAIYTANAKLTDKYKDRIQKAVNPAFDLFVMNGDEWEKNFQRGAGSHP